MSDQDDAYIQRGAPWMRKIFGKLGFKSARQERRERESE